MLTRVPDSGDEAMVLGSEVTLIISEIEIFNPRHTISPASLKVRKIKSSQMIP